MQPPCRHVLLNSVDEWIEAGVRPAVELDSNQGLCRGEDVAVSAACVVFGEDGWGGELCINKPAASFLREIIE